MARQSRRQAVYFGMVVAGVLLAVAPLRITRPPALIWNLSASAPPGLYAVTSADDMAVGAWVAIAPPHVLAGWLDERGYAASGVLLIKQIAALPPSEICRAERSIFINGALVAHALERDRRGRVMPVWEGCRRLRRNEIFLLNAAPASVDGRYFGATARADVVGTVRPIVSAGGRDGTP